MTNLEAAQTNERRLALVTLRDTLAEQLDTATSQVHAQLSAQYRGVLAEVEEIDARMVTQRPSTGGSTREHGQTFKLAAV